MRSGGVKDSDEEEKENQEDARENQKEDGPTQPRSELSHQTNSVSSHGGSDDVDHIRRS